MPPKLSPSRRNEAIEAIDAALGISDKAECTFFERFQPKPGGQESFWRYLGGWHTVRDIPERVILVKGGISSGKSYGIGAAFAVRNALLQPHARGLISANEFTQIETSTAVALAQFCFDFNVPLYPCDPESVDETGRMIANRRLCKIGDASVLVLSANKFGGDSVKAKQGGRGLQVRWFWGDEWCYASRSAFETVNGRLGRGQVLDDEGNPIPAMKGIGVITSTLNRNDPFNWVYEVFDDEDRKPELKRLYTSFNLLTADNDSNDADYLSSLDATYTAELAAIELRGEYAVTKEGRVFSYFDRQRHVDGGVGLIPGIAVHLSFDFNYSPATCLVCQVRGDRIVIAHEFFELNSDTFDLTAKVCGWLVEQGITSAQVHGDASGQQRTANSKETNWSIVFRGLADNGIHAVRRFGNANPSVLDSVNSTNCLLKQDRVLIADNCKELKKDLESVKWDERGDIDKKTDSKRSHLGDCFRYICHDIFPYTDVREKWAVSSGRWSR